MYFMCHPCIIINTHMQVQVVKEKSSGQTFAMKVMRKADILKNPDVRDVLYPSTLVMKLHHKCRLYYNI